VAASLVWEVAPAAAVVLPVTVEEEPSWAFRASQSGTQRAGGPALEGLPGAPRLETDALTPDLAIELLGTRRPGGPRLGADPAAAAELARLCGHVPLAFADHRCADGRRPC
jgi:hypothetical protein